MGTSYIDDNGTLRQGSVYLGSEENIRQHLNSMGELDVEAEIAENAAKVEALGIESLMVENVQKAYEKAAKETTGKQSHEEAWEEESKVKEEVDTDDLYAFMEANNDAKGLVDNAPVQSGAEASNIDQNLGDDGYGDI